MKSIALVLAMSVVGGCFVQSSSEGEVEEAEQGTSSLAGCPAFKRSSLGTRSFDESNEASGLAASRKNEGVLWTHDDSGDSARVFAMTKAGAHLGVYEVAGAGFIDWEDMGIAMVDGAWHLFLADIGGNTPREDVQVYVFPEPDVSATQAPLTATVTGARRLDLHYPDGAYNAESIFVDPIDGALYVVTKSYDGLSKIFVKSAPHLDGTTTTLSEVAQIDFSKAPLFTANARTRLAATGADVSADGSQILVKTKQVTFLWKRAPGATIAQAFAAAPCPVPNGVGEAIAFTPDGTDYFTTAEEVHSEVLLFHRQ